MKQPPTMLRFFRQIRQRLLTDNRFSKYVLYAIGEIMLVVIGILIALQVNDWNQERLERIEENEVLKSVRKDLINTIEEFRFLNQIRNRVLGGTKGLFEAAARGEKDQLTLDSLVGMTFYRPTFNNKQGAIELLFSSGKINLIRQDSIREQLLAWPGLIDDMLEEEVYAMQLFQDQYYPVVARYVVMDDVIAQAGSTSFFGTEIREQPFEDLPMDHNYEALLRDREFHNHLRMRAAHMRITNEEAEDIILHARKLIEMIDREINL